MFSEKEKMKPIAIQLYSVRDDAERDFEGTLRALKGYGYDGVEFAGLYGRTAEEVKALVDEIGLVPVSAHVSLPELQADPEKVINDYKTIGCKNIVIPWLGGEDRPGGANYENVKQEIVRIGTMIRDAGMVLSYHNHDFEFVRLENGEFGFDDLYDTIDSDILKMQMDTCWVSVAGESPIHYLEKYANRCPLLHLKDYVGEKSDNMYALIGVDESNAASEKQQFEFRPVGYGVQKFVPIIEKAEQSGVEWLIVEMDDPAMGKSRMECAEMGIKYLKSL